MFTPDTNLIAYEYYKGQYTRTPVEISGEKDEDKTNDKILFNKNEPAILVLKDDIIDKYGYGLKKGFYNIAPDKYLDFLYIYQSGKIKAKIPVVKTEIIEPIHPKQEKVQKMSFRKYQIQKEKEERKYFKGENPDEIDYKTAQIYYIQEDNSYIIIYSADNYELTGIIKL